MPTTSGRRFAQIGLTRITGKAGEWRIVAHSASAASNKERIQRRDSKHHGADCEFADRAPQTAEEGALFNARANEVGDELVMADYEVTSITFGPSSESATSIVKVEWYLKRDQTVKTTTLEQRWEHRDGKWLMIKQRRTRGDRFPLVPESVGHLATDAGASQDDAATRAR